MKIFIITCEKTKGRIEKAKSICNLINSGEIEIIKDFDVGSDSFKKKKEDLYLSNEENWKKYVYNRTKYRELKDAEISLFLKHIECWKKISKSDKERNFLIVEDDIGISKSEAKFKTDIENFLKFIDQNPLIYDLIYIGETCKTNSCAYRRIFKNFAGKDTLHRVLFAFFTDAYFISKFTCNKLLKELKHISSPADEFLIFWSKNMRVYETYQSLMIQDKTYNSSIQFPADLKSNYQVPLRNRIEWYMNNFNRLIRSIIQDRKIIKF